MCFCRTCMHWLLLSEEKRNTIFTESYMSMLLKHVYCTTQRLLVFPPKKYITVTGIQITYLSSVNVILTKQENNLFAIFVLFRTGISYYPEFEGRLLVSARKVGSKSIYDTLILHTVMKWRYFKRDPYEQDIRVMPPGQSKQLEE